MVAGGDGHVSGSRILESLDPFLGVVTDRIETPGSFGVFILVELAIIEIPLALGVGGIYSPVEEYSETLVLEIPARLEIIL